MVNKTKTKADENKTKTKADETKQKQKQAKQTLGYLLQGLIIEAQSLSISVVSGGLSDFLSFHVV